MKEYLGEELVTDLSSTIFEGYTKTDWAMYFISNYGQFDGSHHKAWVLDQVARILHDTKVIVKVAKWKSSDNEFHEYRVTLDEPSKEYRDWLNFMTVDEEGNEYDYDKGIAP